MCNSILPILEIIVIGGWITLFTYSLLRKLSYFTQFRITLLFLICLGFTILDSTLFTLKLFRADWFTFLFYATQLIAVFLYAKTFNEREIKTDKLEIAKDEMEIFKKISDESPRVICALEWKTNVLLYVNKSYKKLYAGEVGEVVDSYFDPEKMKIYQEFNKVAFDAHGKVVESLQITANDEMKSFKKFFAVINGKEIIITMSND